MRKLLWFSIGFLFSVIIGLQFVHAECIDLTAFEANRTVYKSSISNLVGGSQVGHYQTQSELISAIDSASDPQYGGFPSCGFVEGITFCQQLVNFGGDYYYWYGTWGTLEPCSPDSDDDGILDSCDYYPNDPEPHYIREVGRYKSEDGETIVGQLWETDRGDYYNTGDVPESGGVNDNYYSISNDSWQIPYDCPHESISGTGQIPDNDDEIPWDDDDILPDDTLPDSEMPDDSDTDTALLSKIANNTAATADGVAKLNGYADSINQSLNNIERDTSSIDQNVADLESAVKSQKSSIDAISDNTKLTNDNLKIIADDLGVSNDHLSEIKGEIRALDIPTAASIGESVKDNLIDPSQTIDTTITDNISALDETETLTAIKTKYSDRYDLFITTLKGSDLFSLPFGIFTGPSGSGVSIQTVNIGKWGSSSEQTATIDYSDYDNIWDILRAVLLLLTSFSCFKILVLKKG